MSLQPGARLGPYVVVGTVGAGGMGAVYRARDDRLGREVAIKVLPEALATDEDRLRRFEQEARATAALNHPNILEIFDIGAYEGQPYLVEELLLGETLRERLRGGALPVAKAIECAVQVASGLAAAHEQGIIHRDLKPENLFVSKDGHVKILDFGLAKLSRTGEGAERTPERSPDVATAVVPATQAGMVLGTLGYMAPEQVRGQPCDQRADIFALGCVLYELLSGQRAFRGDTDADTLTAILMKEPPSLSGTGRAIPPALLAIVSHCLEKRPEDRFSSAHDLALALKTLTRTDVVARTAPIGGVIASRRSLAWAGAALVVVAALAGVALWRGRSPAPAQEAPGLKRIAVLPFENVGAAEDAYFADGMTEEVRGKLAALSGLAVIARNSSDLYRGTAKPAKQIAEELEVAYLLTATVRWQKGSGASRMKVTPELVEIPASGVPTTRWQESFDADLEDVFRVQAEIAQRVAGSLKVALGAGERHQLAERPTGSLPAYDAYLRGQELRKAGPGALPQAIAQFERAVELDPDFALAWAHLSFARSLYYHAGVASAELAAAALAAADQALRLSPDLPEGWSARAAYHRRVKQDQARAREDIQRGLQAAPRHAGLLAISALDRAVEGRFEDALATSGRARALDPRSATIETGLCRDLLWLRRFPEAVAACDRAVDLAPADLGAINQKVQLCLSRGELTAARAVVAAAASHVEPAKLVADLAFRWDLCWVLDDAQQELLLSLGPSFFGNSPSARGMVLAELTRLRGDQAATRRLAEEARLGYAAQLLEVPDNAERRALHGLVLAFLGRREEAIREGERAVTLVPIASNAFFGTYYQHQLVRIHVILGNHEQALDLLEPLLARPSYLTPGWLSIDPNFAPLRGNPRFEKLAKTS